MQTLSKTQSLLGSAITKVTLATPPPKLFRCQLRTFADFMKKAYDKALDRELGLPNLDEFLPEEFADKVI
jgi:hypothetical protein